MTRMAKVLPENEDLEPGKVEALEKAEEVCVRPGPAYSTQAVN
jgi:hypothetical protein